MSDPPSRERRGGVDLRLPTSDVNLPLTAYRLALLARFVLHSLTHDVSVCRRILLPPSLRPSVLLGPLYLVVLDTPYGPFLDSEPVFGQGSPTSRSDLVKKERQQEEGNLAITFK